MFVRRPANVCLCVPSTTRREQRRLTTLVICGLLLGVSRPSASATVERLGTATISQDDSARTWTLSAGGASLVLRIDRTGDYQAARFESPTGRNWLLDSTTDTWVIINGKPEPFGRRDVGFDFERVQTFNSGTSLRLDAIYRYRPANVRVARHIAITDGSPTFELWTTFEALGQQADLADLNGFELRVPAGTIRWLTGMKEEGRADGQEMAAFSRQSRLLEPGSGLGLGAEARSSEDAIPWFAIDGDEDQLYAGMLWSGAWSFRAYRDNDAMSLSFGLNNMTTRLDERGVEAPHVLLGVTRGGLAQASIALRSYLVPGLRAGRDFSPLVTFNTWFVNG